jgi:DNA polymerase elongation subunit (family B)
MLNVPTKNFSMFCKEPHPHWYPALPSVGDEGSTVAPSRPLAKRLKDGDVLPSIPVGPDFLDMELMSCDVRCRKLNANQEAVLLGDYKPNLITACTEWVVYDQNARDVKLGSNTYPEGCWLDLTGRLSCNDSPHSVTLSVEFRPHVLIEFPNNGPEYEPSAATVEKSIRKALYQDFLKGYTNKKVKGKSLADFQKSATYRSDVLEMQFVRLDGKRAYGFYPDLRPQVVKSHVTADRGPHVISVFPLMAVFCKKTADCNKIRSLLWTHRTEKDIRCMKLAEVKVNVPLMFLEATQCIPGMNIRVPLKSIVRRTQAFFHTDLEFSMCFDTCQLAKQRHAAALGSKNFVSHRLRPLPSLAPQTPEALQAHEPTLGKMWRLEGGRVPPKTVASFDIECVNPDLAFPDPWLPHDQIVCIGCVLLNTCTSQMVCVALSLEGVHQERVLGVPEADGGEENIPVYELRQFSSEWDLLNGFRDLVVVEYDVDITMGWFTWGFDWKYMFQRLEFLEKSRPESAPASRFPFLSRRISYKSRLEEVETNSKAHGTQVSFRPNIEGRVDIDLMAFVTKQVDCKFTAYSLDFVASQVVGAQKVALGYKDQARCWLSGVPEQRRRLVSYCIVDCVLPIKIWIRKKFMERVMAMASVSRVFCKDIITRGVLWQTFSARLNFAHEHGYFLNELPGFDRPPTYRLQEEEDARVNKLRKPLLKGLKEFAVLVEEAQTRLTRRPRLLSYSDPAKKRDEAYIRTSKKDCLELKASWEEQHPGLCWDPEGDTKRYKGATVLEPTPGFYMAVTTLDFASLYPSIIQELNLCQSTLVLQNKFKNLPGWQYERRTLEDGTEVCFQQNVRGITPRMCAHFNLARGVAKEKMRAAKKLGDEAAEATYDGHQRSCKVQANSIYGAAGADKVKGKYPCKEIARAVTSRGREMIETTLTIVETQFSHYGARVIYGDTDSVMITFGPEIIPATAAGLAKSFEIGREIAKYVSKGLKEPHDLEMEKTFMPYLLLGKKRYMGIKYTSPTDTGKEDSTGDMSVRRDYVEWEKKLAVAIRHELLQQKNPEAAVRKVVNALEDILNNEVPLEDLVKSCKLKKEYKSAQKQMRVVQKMEAREKGSAPKVGDRVAFVMIFGHEHNDRTKDYDLAEDVGYVKDHGIRPDAYHYIKHIKNGILTTLSAFNIEERLQKIFDQAMSKAEGQRYGTRTNGQKTLQSSFFKNVPTNTRLTLKDPAPGTAVVTTLSSKSLEALGADPFGNDDDDVDDDDDDDDDDNKDGGGGGGKKSGGVNQVLLPRLSLQGKRNVLRESNVARNKNKQLMEKQCSRDMSAFLRKIDGTGVAGEAKYGYETKVVKETPPKNAFKALVSKHRTKNGKTRKAQELARSRLVKLQRYMTNLNSNLGDDKATK